MLKFMVGNANYRVVSLWSLEEMDPRQKSK